MDASLLTLSSSGAIAILALTVGGLVDVWLGRRRTRRAVASLVALASVLVCLLLFALIPVGLDPLLIVPTAALGGLAATLVCACLTDEVRPVVKISFGVVWSVLVFVPVAVAVLSVTDGLLGASLATLDLGGALPALVAPGAGAAAVLVTAGSGRQEPIVGSHRSWSIVVLFALAWPLWVLWLVGLELDVDDVTPVIIVNALLAPVASAIAWLVVQRIERARTTPVAAVGGMFCGLVAITAGCGYLDGFGAVSVAAIASAVCSVVGYFLVRRTGQPAWLLVSVLVLGGGVGVGLLGIFATRGGLVFTGQPELLFSQTVSVVTVAVYAFGVTVPLGVGVRLLSPRSSDASPPRAGRPRP